MVQSFPGDPFNDDHAMFRQSLKQFVEREVTPNVREWEEEESLPRELFVKLASLDALGIRVSEEYGGLGLDFWYTAVLIQELVRCGAVGVAVSVLAHAEFATQLIDEVGTPQQKNVFLEPAVRGEQVGSLGVTEPGAGSDVASIGTTAQRVGDEYIVNGTKTFITNGTMADFVTTAVRTGDEGAGGISLLLIPTDTPGFEVGRQLKKIGLPTSDTAELYFDDCRVPVSYRLGDENQGFELIMRGFEGERLVLALICCAQMRKMLKEAKHYGRERETFGQALLDFQTWQHRLADVLTRIQAAEALTYQAVDRYVRGERANALIAMAKLFASEASVTVGHECGQIFGGNRFMEETLMGRLQRDSLAFTVGAGSSEIMREIVVREENLQPE